jgi:predicted ArsR family transcriptional regulator
VKSVAPVAPVVTSHAATGTDARTRERVRALLLQQGPQTAAALGKALGLSSAAVRRHLDALLADECITAREQRHYGPRGRGRPARVYALTETGHAAGPQAYDALAVHALRWLAEEGGTEAVTAFARGRASELEQRLAGAREPEALAVALSQDGYAATVETVPTGTTLCQHHCPVQAVAAEFPQLCDAETEALARVLGTHVQRLATIAHGDGVCTTHIPAAVSPAPTRGAHQ